jgi:hypothetical protein
MYSAAKRPLFHWQEAYRSIINKDECHFAWFNGYAGFWENVTAGSSGPGEPSLDRSHAAFIIGVSFYGCIPLSGARST